MYLKIILMQFLDIRTLDLRISVPSNGIKNVHFYSNLFSCVGLFSRGCVMWFLIFLNKVNYKKYYRVNSLCSWV
jgi:hypothetical protein